MLQSLPNPTPNPILALNTNLTKPQTLITNAYYELYIILLRITDIVKRTQKIEMIYTDQYLD